MPTVNEKAQLVVAYLRKHGSDKPVEVQVGVQALPRAPPAACAACRLHHPTGVQLGRAALARCLGASTPSKPALHAGTPARAARAAVHASSRALARAQLRLARPTCAVGHP